MSCNTTRYIDCNNPTSEALRQELSAAIRSYVQVEQGGNKGLHHHFFFLIFHLLDGSANEYERNITTFHWSCVNLLATLAKPAISDLVQKDMGSWHYDNVLEMLPKLIDFFESLKQKHIQDLLLECVSSEYYGLSDEEMKRLIYEYKVMACAIHMTDNRDKYPIPETSDNDALSQLTLEHLLKGGTGAKKRNGTPINGHVQA